MTTLTPKEKLQAHSAEFRRELFQIADNVYFMVGYGSSNLTFIVAETQIILIDTLESTGAAADVLPEIRKISDKPIGTIIYTHSHRDHVSGAQVFAEGGTPDIFARPSGAGLLGAKEVADVSRKRARRQFAIGEAEGVCINIGLGPGKRNLNGLGAGMLPVTKTIDSENETHVIDGVTLNFIAAPGETPDTMLVYLPEQKILISADNYYKSFPNLYPIRGSAYRDVALWVASIDKMRTIDAEWLLPGHSRPLQGRATIQSVLTDYRDALDYVLQETLAGINAGKTADELAETIRLPEHLAEKPYLQEFYGTVPWSVRAIFTGYLGWFDGNPTNMFPLPAVEAAQEMAALAGGEAALLAQAEVALTAEKWQWCLTLSDHLIALATHADRAREIKIEAMRALADEQINATARNYYLSYITDMRKGVV